MSDVILDREAAEAAEFRLEAERQFATNDVVGPVRHSLQVMGNKYVGEFAQAVLARRDTEVRWLKDLRQYRGKYDQDELDKMVNRSTVFVRKTRVKVKTIDSRVADLLFPAGSEKNWDISPTPKPTIGEDQKQEIIGQMMEAAKQVMQAQQAAMAQQGAPQGPQAAPPQGAFPPAAQPGQSGPAAPMQMPPEPDDETVEKMVNEFVAKAAKKMSRTIEDQLTEARYKDVCVKVVHSGHLYGTGVMKGPLVDRKIHTRFVKQAVPELDAQGQPVIDPETGKPKIKGLRWAPQSQTQIVPFVEHVPLWRFYPDMAATEIEECRYVYERHIMPRNRLNELAARKSFDGAAIREFMKANPKGSLSTEDSHVNEIRQIGDRDTTTAKDNNTYEVIERWGWITGADLREAGYKVEENRLEEDFFGNVWMLHNGTIIKVALSPIDGTTWPYQLYHFDKDESSIFGEGLASVMRDDQTMLNAAIRIMLDNAAITSGPQFEVNMQLISKTEKVDEVYPWKVWKRNGEGVGQQAVRVLEIPSHIDQLTKMAALFEQNADEVTAIPRYMSGENATQGAAGTAAGMSMLMAAANIVIKDLITAWDEGVTRPFLQALYHWNMKFNPDDAIKGDFDVKARGTASLVAKEVRARALNEFAAMVANPMDAPWIKREALLRMRAEALEMGDIVMTEEEYKAKMESPEAQQQQQLQKDMAQAQLGEMQAKVELAKSNAALTMKKVDDLAEQMKLTIAKVQETNAATVGKLVEAVYAALQAGGVATNSPFTAPAADEILNSVGFTDKNGAPNISDLNRQPVQATDGSQQLVNKGAGFVEPPRAGDPATTTNEVPRVDAPDVGPAGAAPDLQPQTGMVGKEAGIETARFTQ